MDALECLLGRRTAIALTGPEPTAGELETLLRAAVSAPDHKLLRPWRFVVVRGAGRQRLSGAFAAAAAEDGDASPERLKKEADKPLRAPLLIAVIASPRSEGKAPRWEQLASAAAAAQNICLAAHGLGLGAAWKSSGLGERRPLREAFAMTASEELLGWIDLGHPVPGAAPRARPPLPLADVVQELGESGLVAYVTTMGHSS